MTVATHGVEYLVWSWTTLLLCSAGWLTHWLMSWAKSWKESRKGFGDFINDNPPAFWVSVVATIACYVIGPSALPFFGIHLEQMPGATAATIANLGAYVIGFASDWLVSSVAKLVRRATGADQDEGK